MSRKLTASDRHTLIKLASTMAVGAPERKAILNGLAKQGALPDATVAMFIRVAVSKLTQYDARLQKRQPNPYRLGHYLGAIEKVEKDVARYMKDDSPEALEALRRSLLKRFTSRGGVSDLPPIRATIKQIDESLKDGLMPTLTRRASVTLADRMKHDKQTAKMIGRILDRTVDEWEKATSTLYLNDLSKAYNQIDGFESIANRMKSRLGDIWASHVDGHGMADFYDEVADSGYHDLMEAYYAAQQELEEMVDYGMADEGNEDAVQERIEEDVLPTLEDAIAQFARDYDPSKVRVDYRRQEAEDARREDTLRQIAEMEAKIKRLRSTL